MGTKERREREITEKRELILDAANAILNEEGMKGLSIRRIAKQIEYSPALIYHYFKNKDAIVAALLKRGYQRIIEGLQAAEISTDQPDHQFKEFTKNYIRLALENPEEYKRVMLISSPTVLEHTSVLFKGAAKERPALGMVYHFLKETYLHNCTDDVFVERTVQVLWTSMFGLVIKILVEDIPKEQQQYLIDHQIDIMLTAIKTLGENVTIKGE